MLIETWYFWVIKCDKGDFRILFLFENVFKSMDFLENEIGFMYVSIFKSRGG